MKTTMETASIQRLRGLSRAMQARIRDGQIEAGRLWTDCMAFHRARRAQGGRWPNRDEMHAFTKGRFALHSQSVQHIAYQLLANVDATTARRRAEPTSRRWLKYPYKEKKFFPIYWPAQAVSYDAAAQRLVLPMGRGRKSLVFKLELDFEPGGAKLVWNEGKYELHLARAQDDAAEPPGSNRGTIDLGEINLATVVTDTGKALVISGRAIRSLKRQASKQNGEIARKRSRCKKGSRRWRKLQAARARQSRRAGRRIRDLRHKATHRAVAFCRDNGVGSPFIGDPRSVRTKDCGRHHNQRISRWEIGKDIDYLSYKAKNSRIACFTGDERGTSSRCPRCDHRHKPKGRVWLCKKCGFAGHRDVVGGVNMHEPAFGEKVTFPATVTYLRPGPIRVRSGMKSRSKVKIIGRSSSPDTGPSAGVSTPAGSCLGASFHKTPPSIDPQAAGACLRETCPAKAGNGDRRCAARRRPRSFGKQEAHPL